MTSPRRSRLSTCKLNFLAFLNQFSAPAMNDAQVESTIEMVVGTYKRLEGLRIERGLNPGDEVNKLFGELVAICTRGRETSFVETVMSDRRIKSILPRLRLLCAEGEALLEAYSVSSMLGVEPEGSNSDSVLKRLQAFPYYNNYIELTRLELAALYAVTSSSSSPIRKIAFIGSGPLPLSSLCLQDVLNSKNSPFGVLPAPTPSALGTNKLEDEVEENELGEVKIMNIDRNNEAIDQSKKLCQALGAWGDGMDFLCMDIGRAMKGQEECENINGNEHMVTEGRRTEVKHWLQAQDVVFLAALVGENQEEKEGMIEEITENMKEGSLLVVRSAEGMRALLYPEFDYSSKKMRAAFDVGVVLHPQNQVVNSVIVGKVKSRKERS